MSPTPSDSDLRKSVRLALITFIHCNNMWEHVGTWPNCSLYPMFHISSVPYIQCFIYPVFLISNVSYVQCSLYPMFHISSVPYIQCFIYPVFLISNVSYIQCSLYPMFHMSSVPYIHPKPFIVKRCRKEQGI